MRHTGAPDCPHCHHPIVVQSVTFPDLLEQLHASGYTGTLVLDFFSGQPLRASGSGLQRTQIVREKRKLLTRFG